MTVTVSGFMWWPFWLKSLWLESKGRHISPSFSFPPTHPTRCPPQGGQAPGPIGTSPRGSAHGQILGPAYGQVGLRAVMKRVTVASGP